MSDVQFGNNFTIPYKQQIALISTYVEITHFSEVVTHLFNMWENFGSFKIIFLHAETCKIQGSKIEGVKAVC